MYRYDGKTLINFTTKDGLPNNRVDEIREDKFGNIYFTSCHPNSTISKFDGDSTARMGRELKLDRQNLLGLRHRIQFNLSGRLPSGQQESSQGFEADELFQNAGKKGLKHDYPDDPPRRRTNKKRGTATTVPTARP